MIAPPPDKRTWRYRLNEACIFNSPADVPAGQGWVDSPAKVLPTTQIESVATVSGPLVASVPGPETPASAPAKRKPKAAPAT